MIETVAMLAAKKVIDLLIDSGVNRIKEANKPTFEKRLTTIINQTIDEYKKIHAVHDEPGTCAFYDSQILLTELLKYRIFYKSPETDAAELSKAFTENPNIILPSPDDLKAFLSIFLEKLAADSELKKLEVEEGYKEEIFLIASKFSEQLSIAKEHLEVAKRTEKNTDSLPGMEKHLEKIETAIQTNSADKEFENYINRLQVAGPAGGNVNVNKFYYRSGKFEFVQRAEWKDLEKFCASDDKILWWAVTGPGGSGKSRLAYEFTRQPAEGWEKKLLPGVEDLLQMQNWDYPEHLLLVIDYVQQDAERIGKWLGNVCKFTRRRKLRVLLLEREGERKDSAGFTRQPLWLEKLLAGADLSTNINQYKYRRELLQLQLMDEDSIKKIAAGYIRMETAEADCEQACMEIVEHLKRVDPEFSRPLYALFLADAWLHNKENMRQWSRQELQSWINDNELKKIKAILSGNEKAYAAGVNLLAFATAVGGVAISDTGTPGYVQPVLEVLEEFAGNKLEERLYALGAVQGEDSGLYLPPLQPDIMGEFFTLHYLRGIHRNITNTAFNAFIEACWAYPREFAVFLMRVVADYRSAEEYRDLLYNKILATEFVTDKERAFLLSVILFAITFYSTGSTVESAIEKLEKLAGGFPESEEIQKRLANGYVNLSAKQEGTACAETIGELEALAGKYPESEEIQTLLASGYVNLSAKQEGAVCAATIGKLELLAGGFLGSEEIQTALANGYVNLSTKQEGAACAATIGKLEMLAGKYPESEEIQTQLANGYVNLSAKQEGAACAATIGKLELLAGKWPGSEGIQTALASGYFNLSTEQEGAACAETIGKLELLAGKWPGSEEIQTQLANGYVNLSAKQEGAACAATIGKLELLAGGFPGSEEIQTQLAKGYVNLSAKQEGAACAETIKKLAVLVNSFTGEYIMMQAWVIVLGRFAQESAIEIVRTSLANIERSFVHESTPLIFIYSLFLSYQILLDREQKAEWQDKADEYATRLNAFVSANPEHPEVLLIIRLHAELSPVEDTQANEEEQL